MGFQFITQLEYTMLDKETIAALKRYQARQNAESASYECWALVSFDAQTGKCVFRVKKPKAPKPKKVAILLR